MNPDYVTTYHYSSNVTPVAAAWAATLFGGIVIFAILIGLIMYIYMAICLMKIAKKTGTENAWFAWIPILNFILMLRLGEKSSWWALLLIGYIIPFVNFLVGIVILVISVMAWMKIAERLGKPNWLGILTVVPIAQLIIPGYLAFSNSKASQQPPIQSN